MSNHLVVLSIGFILMVGVFSFFRILQDYKRYKKKILKSFLFYIFYFNIYILFLFFYHYLLMNLYDNAVPNLFKNPIFIVMLFCCLAVSAFLYSFYFYKTSLNIQNKNIPKSLKIFLIISGLSILSLFVYVLLFINLESDYKWLKGYLIWLSVQFLSIIILNIYSIIRSLKEKSNYNSIKPFSYLFLTVFIFMAITVVKDAFFGSSLTNFEFLFSLLLPNICPIIWYKYFYLKKANYFLNQETTKTSLNEFCEGYGITAREREIVEQILIGKSNQEIADILFISLNTVKTYVYKIFQKFNVKSRNQLTFKIIGK